MLQKQRKLKTTLSCLVGLAGVVFLIIYKCIKKKHSRAFMLLILKKIEGCRVFAIILRFYSTTEMYLCYLNIVLITLI